jgi:hypothetical protein
MIATVAALALILTAAPTNAAILDDWGLTGQAYTNGTFGNWDIDTPRTESGLTNGIYWSEGNDTVPQNTVYGPGPSGGEAYDIEFLGWRRSGGNFQVLGISSVNPASSIEGFHLGDIFIDVDGLVADPDGYNGYDYAISLGAYSTNRGQDHLHPGDGNYTHSADVGLYAINDVDDVHGISSNQGYGSNPAIAGLTDPFSIRGDGNDTGIGVTMTVEQILDDHGLPNWVIQLSIDQALFETLLPTVVDQATYRNLVLHWTLECGNDWIETEAPGDREPVVPEPGTLTLFGLGLATMGMMRRRNRQS